MDKRFFGTYLLVGINVLVFLVMAIIQGSIMFDRPEDFLFMLWNGANFNPLTVGGDYWRLLSSMFMHWGVLHLAVNMYALYSLGRVLEIEIGSAPLFLLYLFTGIVAGLASLLFNVYVASAGASGAIFGIYGYVIVRQVLANYRDKQILKSILINFAIFVVINYFIARGMNVDSSAHIGGFIAGVALSLLHYVNQLTTVRAMFFATAILPWSVMLMPKGQLNYYNSFQAVLAAEQKLNVLYNQPLTDAELVDSLRNVLPVWDSARVLLNQVGNVPNEVTIDTAVLANYISLRKKETYWQLIMRERESYVYLDSIDQLSAQVAALPKLHHYLNYKEGDSDQLTDTTSQKPSAAVIKVFYDAQWRETSDPSAASYFRIGTRDSLHRWQGGVTDYYSSGDVQMKGRYKNGMQDGIFRYYTDHHTYSSIGRYADDYAIRRWETYHENGVLANEIFYTQDGAYTQSVWDSLGHQQVTNGLGKATTWFSNGHVQEEGYYKAGKKDGDWYGYYVDGRPHYQELYHDNRLVRGVALNPADERFVYDQLSVFPFPKSGMEAYHSYLENNLARTPAMDDNHGKVKLNFLVDLDGTPYDFVVTESVCPACDQEAIRLVKEGSAWRPGVLRGYQKIRSNGYVEVVF